LQTPNSITLSSPLNLDTGTYVLQAM